ncbi:uncharacterized protein LOC134839779 [Symsagittifera roscoffensis]|uniref:uncharacterized protein LOC134839779 n=1 Tax=Symsagittifera roscoffensis TaxID=84072 RepID=UPI00307B4D0E
MPGSNAGGRPVDAIWEHFERLPSNKSKCRVCGHEAAANPERMKKHHAKHADSENRPPPAKQPRITDFTVSTSKDDKNKFDILVGRFFFENNIAFNIVESTSFKELCHALHPGYKPPNRKILGNEILDTVHTQLESKCSKKLIGKEVTLCIDGWSNTCNDPIVAASIQHEGDAYIIGSLDTSGEPHTGEYLAEVTIDFIKKAEDAEKYGAKVIAVVTDNAENMNLMRKTIEEKKAVITYGCGAHQMNLLAGDLVPTSILHKVTEVAKLFRNCHLPKAWLEAEGCLKPPMPSSVRWNSHLSVLLWYQSSWTKIKSIILRHSDYFSSGAPKTVSQHIKSLALFQQVEDSVKCLKPIKDALNCLQSDNICAAEAVEAWKDILDGYRTESEYRNWLEAAEKRYNKSVPPVWFLANILHPQYAGRRLTPKELKEKYTSLLPVYVDFVAEGKTVFMENWAPASGCKVENFIKLSRDEQEISQGLAELMITMLKLIPSTAGLERVFSTMGFVHSDLRNRLGSEKVTKLAFCLRSLKSQDN